MKFYTFAVMIVGTVLLLNMAGVTTPITGGLANLLGLGNGSAPDIESSTIWVTLAAILIGSALTGITISAFGSSPDIRYLTGTFVSVISVALISDFIYLWNLINQFGTTFLSAGMGIIMGGILVGFVITVLEFWQNVD